MANKLRDEDLNLNIIVNGDKGKKELGDLEKSTRELTTRNKELRAEKEKLIRAGKQESDEYKAVNREITANNKTIKANESRMSELRKEIGVTGLTMKQLRSEQTRLKRLMDSSTPGTPQWKAYRTELEKVETQMGKIRGGSQRMQMSIGKMADGFNRYFSMITVWVASVTGIILGFKKASNAFAEFDDQVADVMKTTGLTKDEVLDLDKSLQELDTRTAQDELLGLSRVAGKLGKDSVEDVEGFVRAADKIKVALTEDLGGDVEESINQIGKLTDIFGLEQEFGIEKAMLKVGSAINSLGASSTANEGYIVEFTKRVAGIAPSAGISIDKVMGLAATLDQFGQTSEVSSTVYSQVIPDMFKDTSTYAEIARMSVADFKDLLNKDANEAFIKFLEGLHGNNGGLQEMVQKLDGLGLEGKRSISVLGVLANNTKTLREQQVFANVEFEKGTSLTNEFNIKNNTRQAQIEKSRKELALVTRELGQNLSPAVLVSTNGVTYFVKGMTALIRVFKDYYPIIISATAAIVAYTVARKVAAYWDSIHYGYLVTVTALEKGYAVAKALVTGQIKLATIAQRAWNIAVKANPIGALLTVLTITGAAIWQYSKNLDKATASQKALNDLELEVKQNTIEQKIRVEQLLKVARDEKRTLDERKAALEELNRISPEYFGNLALEKINTDQAKQATDEYIKSIEKKARVEAAYQQLVELEKKRNEELASGEAGRVTFWQSTWNNVKAFGDISKAAVNDAQTAVENLTKSEREYLEVKQALTGIIEKENKPGSTGPAIGDRKTIGDKVFEWNGKVWGEVQDLAEESNLSDKEIQTRIEKLEATYNQELALVRKKHLEGKISEDQYNADLLQAELKFFKDKLSVYNKGSKEYEEAVSQALEKQVEVDRTIKNLLLQAEKELAAAKIENLQDGLQKEEASENQRWADEKAVLQERLHENKNLSAQEIAYNDTINQLIEEKEKEHQNRLRKIKSAGDEKNLKKLSETLDAAESYGESTPFLRKDELQPFFDERQDAIRQEYELEKKIAGDNHDALKTAEEKYNKNMLRLNQQRLEAERNMALRKIAIAQSYISALQMIVGQESALGKALFLFSQSLAIATIWIETAKANAKAMAMLVLPPLWGPVVAANNIMAGVQTGLVVAQTVASFASGKGKKEGGYTGWSPNDDKPMGVYHANEWFANAKAVRNPEVKQFLDIFDYYQRTGQISKLNTRTILQSIPVGQMYTGGFSSKQSSNQTPSAPELSTPVYQRDPDLLRAVTTLNQKLEEGLFINMYGTNGFLHGYTKMMKYLGNVKRSK